MEKKMDWLNFQPTEEIREYDEKLRESVRMREQLKQELEALQEREQDIYWRVECAMLETGIRYYETCANYYLFKLEREYIVAEIQWKKGIDGSENCQDLQK